MCHFSRIIATQAHPGKTVGQYFSTSISYVKTDSSKPASVDGQGAHTDGTTEELRASLLSSPVVSNASLSVPSTILSFFLAISLLMYDSLHLLTPLL